VLEDASQKDLNSTPNKTLEQVMTQEKGIVTALWQVRISEKINKHKQMLQIYPCTCLQFQ
jgi:hypothetical protein